MSASDLVIVPVQLTDGTVVLAEVRSGDREEQVSWRDYDVTGFLSSLKPLVRDLIAPLSEFACDAVNLEFSLGLVVKEGKLASLLVTGEAAASIKVSMTWKRPEQS